MNRSLNAVNRCLIVFSCAAVAASSLASAAPRPAVSEALPPQAAVAAVSPEAAVAAVSSEPVVAAVATASVEAAPHGEQIPRPAQTPRTLVDRGHGHTASFVISSRVSSLAPLKSVTTKTR